MVQKRTTAFFLSLMVLTQVAMAAPFTTTPTAEKSYTATEYPTVTESRDSYVLGSWELFPSVGMSAINSTAGFNAGSFISYRLFDRYSLNLEPGLLMSFYESKAQFHFMAGLRYEIDLPETWLRPFARVAVGPTLQTEGETAVFNAYAGFGMMYPVNKKLDFRADAGLQNVDGDAGFLLTAGIGF